MQRTRFYRHAIPKLFSLEICLVFCIFIKEFVRKGRKWKLTGDRRWRENPKGNKEIWESREMS